MWPGAYIPHLLTVCRFYRSLPFSIPLFKSITEMKDPKSNDDNPLTFGNRIRKTLHNKKTKVQ